MPGRRGSHLNPIGVFALLELVTVPPILSVAAVRGLMVDD